MRLRLNKLHGIVLGCCMLVSLSTEAVQMYPYQGVETSLAPNRPESNDVQDILALIENQLNAIANKQYEVAYNSYSAETFRQNTNFNEFKYFVTGYPVFFKNKHAIFGNINFRKQYASVEGTLTSLDGHSQKVEYFLVKEGGLWKVAGIQLIRGPELAPAPGPTKQPYDFQHDIH